MVGRFTQQVVSRPVWGAWIEISCTATPSPNDYSRAPYGARGLKSIGIGFMAFGATSRPVWGAWIEIPPDVTKPECARCRAPYGARGLKSCLHSLSRLLPPVAPRMGRVD